MAGSTANVEIGEVDAYVDKADGNGERHLGHTKGGSVFMVEREFAELLVDQYGSMPVDKILTGNKLKIKLFLAEPTKENQGAAIQEGTYVENEGDSKLGIGTDSGVALSDTAVLLRLHPRKLPDSNRNKDIYIWMAVSVENVELPYTVEDQRVLEITYEALVDETQPDGQRLGRVGDADIS